MQSAETITLLADTPSEDQALWAHRAKTIKFLQENYGFNQPIYWGTILPTDLKAARCKLKIGDERVVLWVRHWPKMTVLNEELSAPVAEQPAPVTATTSHATEQQTDSVDLPPF